VFPGGAAHQLGTSGEHPVRWVPESRGALTMFPVEVGLACSQESQIVGLPCSFRMKKKGK